MDVTPYTANWMHVARKNLLRAPSRTRKHVPSVEFDESKPARVMWDADKQDGLLVVQNLAQQPADKDYRLWVIDPQHAAPVDAGVFTLEEKGNVHFRFKPKASVKSADKFAVTWEKMGGVSAPQGTMVLAGSWL